MKAKIAVALLIVVLVVSALAGVKFLQIGALVEAGKKFVPPPEAVSTAVVHAEKWQESLRTIGSISAVQGVELTAELGGTVQEIAFDSGAMVAKGQLLVKLDVSSEEAQLRSIEAQADLARLNLERTRKLRAENTLSQAELDTAEATLKQYVAEADNIRSIISKKTIRAPFAGKLGIRQINVGEFLDKDKPIVSLQSLAPVFCDFQLPQQELGKLQTDMKVHLTTDTYPEKVFEGRLTAINPDVDASTRGVRLQATFENREQLLRPGMFTKVEVLLPHEREVLVIPATAVLSAPYGDAVFVVESKSGETALTVRQQFIRTDGAQGDFVSVAAGLKSGERVVSAGLFKLRNGTAVVENNEIKPAATKSPTPSNS